MLWGKVVAMGAFIRLSILVVGCAVGGMVSASVSPFIGAPILMATLLLVRPPTADVGDKDQAHG